MSETAKIDLKRCQEQLIISTQQYVKRQLSWIKNRLAAGNLLKNRVFELEFESTAKFGEQVVDKAVKITKEFLTGALRIEVVEVGAREEKYKEWKKFKCEECELTLNGEREYKIHVESKKHYKRLQHLKNLKIKFEREMMKQGKEVGVDNEEKLTDDL